MDKVNSGWIIFKLGQIDFDIFWTSIFASLTKFIYGWLGVGKFFQKKKRKKEFNL